MMARAQDRLLDVFLADAGFQKDSTDAQLYDYNRDGLGLRLFEPLQPGMMLQVGIPNGRRPEDWNVIIWVKVQVISQRRQHLGWIVDCDFSEKPPASLFIILDQLTDD